MFDLILASQSPRRRELLSLLTSEFVVLPADVDESQFPAELPLVYAERIALKKARKIANLHPDSYVLAADTVVYARDEYLGKPVDGADAAAMLHKLSGKSHQVYCGHALVNQQANLSLSLVTTSHVEFREISPQEIRDYCATGEPDDKAGAYALQGRAAKFVKSLSGSYTGIIGIDLAVISEWLNTFKR